MRGLKLVLAVVAATAGITAGGPASQAQPGMCFRSADWSGWKASKDGVSVYIGVGASSVFRLELAQPCPELNDIDAKLVTRTYSSWVCRPDDIDLRVLSPGVGLPSYCRIKKMSRLYPSEVKALPKAMRP